MLKITILSSFLVSLCWCVITSPTSAQEWARDEFKLCRVYNRLVRTCVEMSPNIREAHCPALNGMSRRELAEHLSKRIETVPEHNKPALIEFMVRECSRYL